MLESIYRERTIRVPKASTERWIGIPCSRSNILWNDFLSKETVLFVAAQTRCCAEFNRRDVRTVTGGPRCTFSTRASYCLSLF
jgi:hypothetical protein